MRDPERRRRIEELCEAALARTPRERAAFVAASCGGDDALRHEVEALLAHAQTAEGFLAAPLGAVAAHVLGEERGVPLVGRQIGPYRISSLLGAGGMGEVYQARDTKLDRSVAIKILPESLAHHAEQLARFEREAKILAALNHPNIAIIHGFEESDGIQALVMELVEGPTLADRIAQGPIPLDEALAIARQIAEALEAAHEQGIIHRDLKPANIKLRPDGTAKVLDFGLAKALGSHRESTPEGLGKSPTITSPAQMTGLGVLLGTAAYMSPEHARGKAVDKRTDIWAFGCVLFEMLTGRRAFEGEDATDTLAAVVHGDLEWSALPLDTPEAIHRLLRRCLKKEPKERLRDIGDAVADLVQRDPSERSAVPTKSKRHAWMAVAVLLLALVAALIPLVLYFGPAPLSTRNVQFEVPVQPGTAPRVAISPDGHRIAYLAPADSGKLSLWLRSLNALNAEMLPGTEGAVWPFWSPDSQSIAFFSDGKLKKIGGAGGHPQVLTDTGPVFSGGTWNRQGILVFTSRVLRWTTESGGDVIDLSTLDKSLAETFHAWPSFLPDGRHFLYLAWSDKAENRAIYIGSLDSKTRTRLMAAESMAIYAAPGFILFGTEGGLMARPFDPDRLEFTGDAVPVAEEFRIIGPTGRGSFDASEDGTLIYRAGAGSAVNRELIWVDRTGKRSAPIGAPIRASTLRLSPDGKRVAFSETSGVSGAGEDLWIYDIDRDLRTRLTTDPSIDHWPVWSPDGSQLVFDSHRGGKDDTGALYEKPANGAMPERLLLEPEPGMGLGTLDCSQDGRLIVFSTTMGGPLKSDLWVLPVSGDRKPFPYLMTPFDESEASFSPNGRWLAYTSNESGSYQVFVRSFPDSSRDKRQISTQGGAHPRWKRDGREIYYLDPAGRIVAVEVMADQKLEIGKSTPLFDSSLAFPVRPAGPAYGYDVTPDGQQFLISALPGNAPPPIVVVLNWAAGLKRH